MDQRRLLHDLLTLFDDAAVRSLCERVGHAFSALEGWDRADKTTSLVRVLARAGELDRLARAMVEEKPALSVQYGEGSRLGWIDSASDGFQDVAEEGVTLEWPDSPTVSRADTAPGQTNASTRSPIVEGPTLAWPKEPGKRPPPDGRLVPDNPYKAGGKLLDESMFFGRIRERKRISSRLRGMVCCAISGSPRIGKSWLLNYIMRFQFHQPETKMLFAHLDGFAGGHVSAVEVHESCLALWYGRLLDAPPPRAKDSDAFRRQLRTLRSAGYRPVLVIDRFETLWALDDGLREELVADWSSAVRSGYLALLVATRPPLPQLVVGDEAAQKLSKLFWKLELGMLDEHAAGALLRQPLMARGVQAADAWIAELLSLCGRHPYDLQLGASLLVEALRTDSYSPSRLRSQLYSSGEAHWRGIWSFLSPVQRMALSQLVDRDGPSQLNEQYVWLLRQGLLEEGEDGLRYYGRGFADRIRGLSLVME